ncbi:MAG: hypothetical protein ABIX10_06395, partial [Acidimicrobiales bacterium]
MTTFRSWREVRAASLERLRDASIDHPAQELRWMIERASGRTSAEQVAALDEAVTEREAVHLEAMLTRRGAGEPLQYVVGSWGF